MTEEQQPTILTVARLLEDLKAFDGDAEVAMIISGSVMSMPVVNLIKTETNSRKFALLAVPIEAVNASLTYRSPLNGAADAKAIEELGGVN